MSDHIEPRDIAVIGLACRFPMSSNYNDYWRNLLSGNNLISYFKDEELIQEGIDPQLLVQKNYIKAKSILPDINFFDADLFGIAKRDAMLMDPQQRLALECAWEALEDAGYLTDKNEEMIGVFVGCNLSSYYLNNILLNEKLTDEKYNMSTLIGNGHDYFATKLSYYLNLHGPSKTIQTACSSSLACIHDACQSLFLKECDIAIAGGASISIPQKEGYLYVSESIQSSDGYCRVFDKRSSGTVFGDGVGLVVLKSLDKAIEDGDTIRAVIKGSSINNDGKRKLGYATPSVQGQSEVIALAYDSANINPETISYIEAHGTGTAIGDPIEVQALTNAFRLFTDKKNYCALGSVKANLGHLVVAAGVAGLIKVVLALSYKKIPQQINFESANPNINFQDSPFYVSTKSIDWVSADKRRAGISSFGIGGTNVHMILEEAPPLKAQSRRKQSNFVLPISASSKKSVMDIIPHIKQNLRQYQNDIGSVAYTLQVGRKELLYRCIINYNCELMVKDLSEIKLSNEITKVLIDNKTCDQIWFLSPLNKEGSLTFKELYLNDYFFKAEFNKLIEKLSVKQQEILHVTLFNNIYSNSFSFILGIIFARLFAKLVGHPKFICGLGINAVVAAVISEVFTLEEGLHFAISLDNNAFGKKVFDLVKPKSPTLSLISATLGTVVTQPQILIDDNYWLQEVNNFLYPTSNFLQDTNIQNDSLILELTDNQMPQLNIKEITNYNKAHHFVVKYSDLKTTNLNIWILSLIGKLWLLGKEIDWQQLYHEEKYNRLPLATYCFDRDNYWVDNKSLGNKASPDNAVFSLEALDKNFLTLTTLDKVIAVVWMESLGVAHVDLDTDFFMMGGDSLHQLEIIEKINHLLNLSITINDMLSNSTLRKFSTFIRDILVTRNAQ